MYYLRDLCFICFCNENLQPLLSSSNDGITYYIKLKSTMSDMCVTEMVNQRLLCKECCDTIDTIYTFRQKCLRSKVIYKDYISQLRSVSHVEGNASVHLLDFKHDIKPEEIYIKTEYDSNDNPSGYDNSHYINDIKFEDDVINDQEIYKTNKRIADIDISTLSNKQNFDESVVSITDKKECITEEPSERDRTIGTSFIIIKEEIDIKMENEHCKDNNETDLYPMKLESNVILIGENPHKCSLCNTRFSRASNLKTHMRIHTGERPYECYICNKRFSDLSNLTKHMPIHSSDKPYQCNVCNKSYTTLSRLTLHTQRHTGENSYECNICNKRFIEFSKLNLHLKIHNEEKPHKCSICNKQFTTFSYLTVHMRSHTGEKPYICSVCNKRFTDSSRLTIHMRIHTGERPYECSICNKKFSISGNLTKHMRVHTAQKPYNCSICNKSFNLSSGLTVHMRSHTGEKKLLPKNLIKDQEFTKEKNQCD